jgi:hypothetical protein
MARVFAVICCLVLLLWGCAGETPAPADEEQAVATTATGQEQSEDVFESDFEEGDAEEWGEQEQPADDEDEEPEPGTTD